MKYGKCFVFMLFLTITTHLFAHQPLMEVKENGDGTITISAGISDGSTSAGAKVTLHDKITGEPILRTFMPDSGMVIINQPTIPYVVTLDLGEGHVITKTGPIYITEINVDTIIK